VAAHPLAFDEGAPDEGASLVEDELQLPIALPLQGQDVLLEATLVLGHGRLDIMFV
jgi:hypothetical protein